MGGQAGSDPNRRAMLAQQPTVIIPDTGAAKYWYVDPNASKKDKKKQTSDLDDLMEALSRLGVISDEQQSSGKIGF